MFLKGTKYYLYVHSYLHYGLLAARAEILTFSDDSGNPCILAGCDGSYKYGGETYKALASSFGSSVSRCSMVADKALKVKESTCSHMAEEGMDREIFSLLHFSLTGLLRLVLLTPKYR